MSEIACTTEVFEVVHTTPVAMHVLHLDLRAVFDQRVEPRLHIERVEIGTRAQLGKRLLQTLTARAAYAQQTYPTPLRCLRIARYALQEYLLPEQIAIVLSRAVGEI